MVLGTCSFRCARSSRTAGRDLYFDPHIFSHFYLPASREKRRVKSSLLRHLTSCSRPCQGNIKKFSQKSLCSRSAEKGHPLLLSSASQSHPSYNVDRVNAFVHDLAQPKLSLFEQISHHPFGLPSTISVIFVLSAIPPQLHEAMLRSLIECLPQGGSLLLRDYAHGDLAQQRFDTRPDAAWTEPSLLSADKDYYRRGDGTLTYFFKREELVELADRCGLIGDVSVMQTTVTNRKQGAAMERRFVQARWTHRSEL